MSRSGKQGEHTEQLPRGNKKTAKIESFRPEHEHLSKQYNDLTKFPSENPYPVLCIDKNGTILYANKASELLLKAKDSSVGKLAPQQWCRLTQEVFSSGHIKQLEERYDGRVLVLQAVPTVGSDYVNFYGMDITEQKMAEDEREITIKLLSLINSKNQIHELMKLATTLLKDWSGCEAVGIRLQDGDDFPYFETSGFPAEFIQSESKLCSMNELGEPVRDGNGRIYLECMCGNIISGRFNPFMSFFTKHGSFWTNCSSEFAANTTEAERLTKTRNRCVTAGYESLALIPLRAGKETFGLLQFNSKQKNVFTPEKISLLERIADNLAIALAQRKIEESLRESEDKFRHVFDYSAVGKSITTPDGQIQPNKAFCEMLGYSYEELKAKKWQDITYPDDVEINQKSINSLLSGQEDSVQLSKRYIHKNGNIVWADFSTSLRRDKAGKPLYFMSTIVDISERKKAEEARFETLSRFSGFAEASQYGMGMADIDGHIVFVNSTLVQMLGEKSSQDCIGKHFPTAYYSESMTRRLQEEVMPALIRDGHWHGELELLTVDCRCVPTDENYFVIRDEQGRPRYLADILTDITERKLAERALQESEEKYRTVIETTDTGFVALDEQGRVLNANLNYAHMVGHSSVDKIIGRLVMEWTAPYDLERNRIEISKCFNNGSVRNLEIDYQRTDGTIAPIEINATTLHTKNGKIILTICRDITGRKQVEMELKRQMDELISWQNVTIGRESRVIELKKEVNELLAKLGQSPRYENQDK